MTLPLTHRQQQVLDIIKVAIARTGAPPTRAEIARELGFKSANGAEEHLQAMAKKGYVILGSGTARNIRITELANGPRPAVGVSVPPMTEMLALPVVDMRTLRGAL